MISEQLWQQFDLFFDECREKHIPVVRKQTAKLLCELIEKNKPQNILELGTAVGYSGTLMLLSNENSNLVTVEINKEFCELAKQTFDKYKVQDRVHIINNDILSYLQAETTQFDFIFLDGPKGQYVKYLPYLKKLISKNGIVLCDDVLYFGMVLDDSKVIHKKITIVRNLREFISKCQSDKDFDCELLDLEDGVLILRKK